MDGLMIFHFEIPTPKSCIKCQFKEVRVGKGYGSLYVECRIMPDVKIPANIALTERFDKCPGRVENES